MSSSWSRAVRYIAILVLLTYGAFPVPASTDASLTLPTYIEVSAGEWPPFLGADLPQQGVVARIIRDIFAEAGIAVRFTFLPWARAMHDAKSGKYDAAAVWLLTEDRRITFLYSEAVLSEQHVLFFRKSQPLFWQSFTDLQGLLIGGLQGFSYGAEFDRAVETGLIQLDRVASTEQNFQRLARGRLDAMVEEVSVGYHLMRNLPEISDQISHYPRAILITESFLLFPKANPQSETLNKLFNQRLQEFRASGRYDSYFDTLTTADSGALYQPTEP
ncbi:substrate-binding periplasmic protein [Alishewanella sp. d11]|uniref:substrate-binding periplasmic protein n=1 Tax=Alishewanella sp. d11 TaxID=3414030 RepID=UPI003BF796E6